MIVVEGGNLFDGTGRVMKDSAVLIENGRFKKVCKKGEETYPKNADVINIEGKTVLPGLMDMHVHSTWIKQVLGLFLTCGVTTIRDLGSPLDEILGLRDRIARGDEVGPRIFASGPLIDGPGTTYSFADVVESEEGAKQEIKKLRDSGVDLVKLYYRLTPKVLKALIDAAHEVGFLTAGHLLVTRPEDAIKLGIDCLEHITTLIDDSYLTEEDLNKINEVFGPMAFSRSQHLFTQTVRTWSQVNLDSEKVRGLIDLMISSGVFFCPTFVNYRERLVRRSEPDPKSGYNVYYPDEVMRQMEERSASVKDRLYKYWGGKDTEVAPQVWRKMEEFVGRLKRGGGKVITGTDAGEPNVFPGFSLLEEIEQLVKCGFSTTEALMASTKDSAVALGKESDLGTVEAGKIADLVVVDGDPLKDIKEIKKKIEIVIKDEKLINREGLLKKYR
ncbi:MAG: amidohydrolase family protein [Methanobacteriota archaeon]